MFTIILGIFAIISTIASLYFTKILFNKLRSNTELIEKIATNDGKSDLNALQSNIKTLSDSLNTLSSSNNQLIGGFNSLNQYIQGQEQKTSDTLAKTSQISQLLFDQTK